MSNGMGTDKTVYAIAISGNNIFAGTRVSGVYLSSDNGINWTQTSLNNNWVFSLAISGNNVFAGTDMGVFLSTNNGLNWTQTSLNNHWILSLTIDGNNFIYAATDVNFIYRSINNGLNWTQTSLPDQYISALANNNNVFAGACAGVYRSTNNGMNWIQTSLNYRDIYSLATSGNNVFAGTDYGVFHSTDNGISWIQTAFTNQSINALLLTGYNIFAGADSGVYLSTNYGTNWLPRNEGFPGGYFLIQSFCIINNYLIAGTSQHGAWRRYLPELVGIKLISNILPERFELYQNYPNPFNPKTIINFQLPMKNYVILKIYDILGREVSTLINEELKAGTYQVDWDASNYTSGVYFYKFTSREFTETKKMILMK
jgi:photosystem II stability/assembly factor-like uncharacterized protein